MSASASHEKTGDTYQETLDHSPFLPLLTSRHLEIEEYMRLLNLAAVSTSEGQDQLAQHMVIKLEHMKDTGKAQHEYVVATVRDHNQNRVRLSIGRSKGQTDVPKVEARKKSPKNSYSSNGAIALASLPNSSQDSILKPTNAMDVVQNIGDKTFPASRVRCIFEPLPEPIPLLHLAIIIAAVHDRNSLYTMLRSQCYWFAMLVMGVAMTQGGQVKLFTEKPSKNNAGIEFEKKFLNPLILSDPNDVNQSELSRIPIPPPPSDEKSSETIGNLGISIGKHNGIPIVALHTEEIRIVALEAQQRYEAKLSKLEINKTRREAATAEEVERKVKEAKEQAQKESSEEIAALRRALAAAQR